MTDHFTVPPGVLREHAAAVRRIAESVGLAADAADEVGIGGVDTYGVICSPILMPAMHLFFGDAKGLIKKAAGTGDDYATGLESNSDVYESVEGDAKSMLNKVHSDLA